MNERNNNGYHKQNPNQFHNRSSYSKPYDKSDKPQLETFIPIPDTTKELLKSTKSNFGLYSPRMTVWGTDGKASKDNISELMIQSRSCYENIVSFLNKKKLVMNSYIQEAKSNGYIVYEKTMYTKTPFISGLGSGHPTETGMILDRTLGVP